MGCADVNTDPLATFLRGSAHPISVLKLTKNEVDGGSCHVLMPAKSAEISVQRALPFAAAEAFAKHTDTVRLAGAISAPSQNMPVFHHMFMVVAS